LAVNLDLAKNGLFAGASFQPCREQRLDDRSFQDAEIFSSPRIIWARLSSVYHSDFNDMMFGPLPPEEHVLETLELLSAVISEFEKKRSLQVNG